ATPQVVAGTAARAHQTRGSTHSLSDGSFEFLGLLPGHYEIQCWGSETTLGTKDTVKVVLDADTKRDDIEIVVQAHGSLRGTVRDETGTALRNAQVNPRAVDSNEQIFSARSAGVTDGEGRYEISNVAPGEYRVVATHGYFDAIRRPGQGEDEPDGDRATIVAGETTELDLVVARTDGEITGRVVAEGGPVGDAFSNFSRVSESEAANASSQRRSVRWGNWGKTPILTDADGRFTVTGLTP